MLWKERCSANFFPSLWFSGNEATLAQLVERLIRNQQVAGSTPAGGSRRTSSPGHGQRD
jgi:hypothetical protein